MEKDDSLSTRQLWLHPQGKGEPLSRNTVQPVCAEMQGERTRCCWSWRGGQTLALDLAELGGSWRWAVESGEVAMGRWWCWKGSWLAGGDPALYHTATGQLPVGSGPQEPSRRPDVLVARTQEEGSGWRQI